MWIEYLTSWLSAKTLDKLWQGAWRGRRCLRQGFSNDSTAAGGELSNIDSAVKLPVADRRSENCTRNRCFTMFIMRWYSLHENCDEWISHNILSKEEGVPYHLSYKFYKYINIRKTLIVIATV